jgi:hypothetical protein
MYPLCRNTKKSYLRLLAAANPNLKFSRDSYRLPLPLTLALPSIPSPISSRRRLHLLTTRRCPQAPPTCVLSTRRPILDALSAPPTIQRLQRRIAAEGSRASRPSSSSKDALTERGRPGFKRLARRSVAFLRRTVHRPSIENSAPWLPPWPRPGKEARPPTPARR